MTAKLELIEEALQILFKQNNMKIVDCSKYDGVTFQVPKELEVSPKWVARKLSKIL